LPIWILKRKKEILRQIKQIVQEELGQDKVKIFLFGSQAQRQTWKPADVDIGIDAGQPVDPDKWVRIVSKIEELSTLFTFDIVDFNKVEKQFKEVALAKTEAF